MCLYECENACDRVICVCTNVKTLVLVLYVSVLVLYVAVLL